MLDNPFMEPRQVELAAASLLKHLLEDLPKTPVSLSDFMSGLLYDLGKLNPVKQPWVKGATVAEDIEAFRGIPWSAFLLSEAISSFKSNMWGWEFFEWSLPEDLKPCAAMLGKRTRGVGMASAPAHLLVSAGAYGPGGRGGLLLLPWTRTGDHLPSHRSLLSRFLPAPPNR